MWCHRFRHGRRGRPPKPIRVEGPLPSTVTFHPNPARYLEPILMDLAELEAFRLVDLEGLSQEEAAKRMGVSRGTVWRLVKSARQKAARALHEGRPLQIVVGNNKLS